MKDFKEYITERSQFYKVTIGKDSYLADGKDLVDAVQRLARLSGIKIDSIDSVIKHKY